MRQHVPSRGRSTALQLAALVAALVADPSSAESAWRCRQDGRVIYQSSPCMAGERIEVGDPRSEAQRQAAQADQRRFESAAAQAERQLQWRATQDRTDEQTRLRALRPVSPKRRAAARDARSDEPAPVSVWRTPGRPRTPRPR